MGLAHLGSEASNYNAINIIVNLPPINILIVLYKPKQKNIFIHIFCERNHNTLRIFKNDKMKNKNLQIFLKFNDNIISKSNDDISHYKKRNEVIFFQFKIAVFYQSTELNYINYNKKEIAEISN